MSTAKKLLVCFLLLFCFQTAVAEWRKEKSNTLAWLRDVYFLNEKTGWIAGSGGTFLETRDGGNSWRQNEKFTADAVLQVYFADERAGWLLCERDVYNLGANMPSYVLRTRDGGANWEKLEFAERGRERIVKLLFDRKGAVITAFGEGGAFFTLNQDGKTWKKTASFIKYLLLDGMFSSEASGAVVGAGGTVLFTENGGASWDKASIFGDKEAKLRSVFFINQKTGWSVGASGVILQTLSGGKTWREQKSGTTKDLNDVFFINTAEGFAVGDEGVILQTTTAGNVWNPVVSPARHRLEKVFFTGKKGFAVGFGGTILRYNEAVKSTPKETKPLLRTIAAN
ncbi:MAG TPA: YCF48-related protein [Pyrinomonadaceae bacterium]|jgi:photosystem II stability/assembly factor-like uncharacterized protein